MFFLYSLVFQFVLIFLSTKHHQPLIVGWRPRVLQWEGPPTFDQPEIILEKLLEYGNVLVQEQENVKRVQLAEKYLNEAALGDANEDAIKNGNFYGQILNPKGLDGKFASGFRIIQDGTKVREEII